MAEYRWMFQGTLRFLKAILVAKWKVPATYAFTQWTTQYSLQRLQTLCSLHKFISQYTILQDHIFQNYNKDHNFQIVINVHH